MASPDVATVRVHQSGTDSLKDSVTLTLVEGPDEHDYVVGLAVPIGGYSATKAISVVHAAGCRKCTEQ